MRWQVGCSPHNRRPGECNLGPSLTLEPNIEHFLGVPTVTQEVEQGCNLLQEPLVENFEVWVE